jgi:hypothetical protein
MDEQFFDDLAKGLDEGSVSRGRALKLVGVALLAAMLPPLFPQPAGARARKRCNKEGNVFLAKGNCHCGNTCGNATRTICHSKSGCTCYKTAEGSGFCAAPEVAASSAGCSASNECTSGYTCAVLPGCAGSGGSCTRGADCHSTSPGFGCINSHYQQSFCILPCPT